MPNPRNAKLADQIKVILATALERRVKDPRLGFITVTDVRLTGDNREATVFYTVMGDDSARAGTAAALASATGMLRTAVGSQLKLRHTPTLAFVLDATPESARNIEDLLAGIERACRGLSQARGYDVQDEVITNAATLFGA